MKYARILWLLAAAGTALLVFVVPASASTITSSLGTAMATGSTLEGTSTNSELHFSGISIKCSHSQFKGTLVENGTKNGSNVRISYSTLDFTGCNYAVTVLKAGSLSIDKSGTALSTGAEIKMHTSVGECIITTSNTDLGSLTGGTGSKLDIDSAAIPRTGGSFFCGSSFEWTGDYTITSPSYVAVH